MCLDYELNLHFLLFVFQLPGSLPQPVPVSDTLHRQHHHAHQMADKKCPWSQSCGKALAHMIQEIPPHIKQFSQGKTNSAPQSLLKESRSPVREKERCKVFGSQVVFDAGIHSHYRCQYRKSPHSSLPPAFSNPEKCRKQQKQSKIRSHQCHCGRQQEQQHQFISLLPAQIINSQRIENNQHTEKPTVGRTVFRP